MARPSTASVRFVLIARDVTPGERPEERETEAPAIDGARGEQELPTVRVVEARALLLVELLERHAQTGPGGQETEPRVDRLQAFEIAGGVGPVDVLGHGGGDLLAGERDRRHRGRERKAPNPGQATADGGERVLVHLPAADDASGPAGGESEESRERDCRPPHSPSCATMMAG